MCNIIWKRKDLGPVDAYEQAVAAGFTGTHEEWIEMLGNTKEWSEQAYASKIAAQIAQNAAETAAAQDVEAWLEENFSNPENPPLDNTLSNPSAAARADAAGKTKTTVDIQVGEYQETRLLASGTNYRTINDNGEIRSGSQYDYVYEANLSEGCIGIRIFPNTTPPNRVVYYLYDADGNYIQGTETEIWNGNAAIRWIPENARGIKYHYNHTGLATYWLYAIGPFVEGVLHTKKADKVQNATEGNLAALDAEGNLVDSEKPASDVVCGPDSATNGQIAVFDGTTGKQIKSGGYEINKLMFKSSAAKPVVMDIEAPSIIRAGRYFWIGDSLVKAIRDIRNGEEFVTGENVLNVSGGAGFINVIMEEINTIKAALNMQ